MQIANSNIIYPALIVVKIINDEIDEYQAAAAYILISVKTMCPAVMFAANRNDRVIGRTKILVVSIITKKGFNHSGAPSGRKWAVDFFGAKLKLDINILIHIGKPIHSVIIKCLEEDMQ